MNLKIAIPNIIFCNTSSFFMWLPFLRIRRLYLSIFVKELGKNNYIGRNIDVRFPMYISIGDNNIINKNCVIDGRGGLEIGNNVDIAQDTFIWTAQHDYDDDHHKFITDKVYVEDYVWIAARSTVLPGVRIGRGAVVAAGSIVTKDVAPLAVVAGVPAKKISERGSKLLYTLH